MSKFSLEIEEDFEFFMLGICSHIKDYRLCWEINRILEVELSKEDDLEIVSKGEVKSYSFNACEEPSMPNDYYLISNKSEFGYLIPEEKNCDYFLIVKGAISETDKEKIIALLNGSKNILTTYCLKAKTLKSRNNLIF